MSIKHPQVIVDTSTPCLHATAQNRQTLLLVKIKPFYFFLSFAIAAGLAMAAPGGVVVEGRLTNSPQPGAASPLTITITKGNLEYFGRLLISLPSDCQLQARQLHGGGMTIDPKRNMAVISWLKLPEAQQFDLLFDLEVSPAAVPGPRSFDWDFSFIRNNDRETVRPTPFHFEITPANAAEDSRRLAEESKSNPPIEEAIAQDHSLSAPHAMRTVREMTDGRLEVNIEFEHIPSGGFVKCEETMPAEAVFNVTSGGGSTVQTSQGAISFIWFDYQPAGSITYIVQLPRLHVPGDFIGTLSFILDDAAKEIPVIDGARSKIYRPEPSNDHLVAEGYWFEVQVAATKKSVVTDYFDQKLNFSLPLIEEKDSMWVKYLFGHFEGYKSARDCREDFNEQFGFIGPFVVSKRNGQRISVQEALTKTGESWMP